MKKEFNTPEMELTQLELLDIIATSYTRDADETPLVLA